jgi:hypothetical protein
MRMPCDRQTGAARTALLAALPKDKPRDTSACSSKRLNVSQKLAKSIAVVRLTYSYPIAYDGYCNRVGLSGGAVVCPHGRVAELYVCISRIIRLYHKMPQEPTSMG